MNPSVEQLGHQISLVKLALECAGLNVLLPAGLAAIGAELGLWLAGCDGSGIGLAAGLAVGFAGHRAGSRRIADSQSTPLEGLPQGEGR